MLKPTEEVLNTDDDDKDKDARGKHFFGRISNFIISKKEQGSDVQNEVQKQLNELLDDEDETKVVIDTVESRRMGQVIEGNIHIYTYIYICTHIHMYVNVYM
jgi:Rieske Fe-S protein